MKTTFKPNLNETIDSCKNQTPADHHRHNYSYISYLNLKESSTTNKVPTLATPYSFYSKTSNITANAQPVPINEILSIKLSMVDFNDPDEKKLN